MTIVLPVCFIVLFLITARIVCFIDEAAIGALAYGYAKEAAYEYTFPGYSAFFIGNDGSHDFHPRADIMTITSAYGEKRPYRYIAGGKAHETAARAEALLAEDVRKKTLIAGKNAEAEIRTERTLNGIAVIASVKWSVLPDSFTGGVFGRKITVRASSADAAETVRTTDLVTDALTFMRKKASENGKNLGESIRGFLSSLKGKAE